MRPALLAVIVALGAGLAGPGVAADERPLIGLVLSGGGARGGAHIGVIRALEELRVPIDIITGTSIGAAIGGLYASGMTVQELEDFVNGIDWDAAFLNTTPRQLKSFRRKREDDLFLLQLRPGLSDEGISLPIGVVQGQVIDTIMGRITLPVGLVRNFDDLPIPFRAVAGDLATGDAVVLGTGSLALAIRASMAVPAAMTPVEIDGHILVDGGIANNLPVGVAHDMGAERIIAVDISDKLNNRDELRSIVAVTAQLTSLLTARGTNEQIAQLRDGDLLLIPEFAEDYSSVSFSRVNETIDTGYQYVMAHREEFLPYQVSEEDYAAWRAARPNPRQTTEPVIDFVHFDDSKPLAASVIEARIQDIRRGEPLDFDALQRSLDRVYGLGIYQNVRFTLVQEGQEEGIDLDLVERSWGPSYIQLGLRYTAATDEDAVFGLQASYLRTGINELGGEWRATFLLGSEPGFVSDLYQPLGHQALNFVNPAIELKSNVLNVFADNELVAETKLRTATFELGFGRELMDWAEIRGGFRVGSGDTRFRIGDPAAVPYDSFRRGELFARFSVDKLDNISFPRSGTYSTIEWRGSTESVLGGDGDYDQLLVNLVHAHSWGRHTVLSTVRYDTTISGQSPVFGLFGIGGFRDLSGLNSHELTGQHVTRIGASYYRKIGDIALFQAFVGVSAELGNAWARRGDISFGDSIFGKSVWAGVDTPVGPVFVAYGRTDRGDDAAYVFLGRLF
jgi:NTE family protein